MQGHLNFVLCQGCLQALRLGPLRLAIPAAQSLPHTLTACNPSCAVDSAIQHPVSSTRQSLMQGTVPAQTDITRGHFRACLSKAIHRRDSQDCHGYARQHAQPTVEQGPHTHRLPPQKGFQNESEHCYDCYTNSLGCHGSVWWHALVTRALRKRSIPHSQPCASCGSLYASRMLDVTPVFWNLHTGEARPVSNHAAPLTTLAYRQLSSSCVPCSRCHPQQMLLLPAMRRKVSQ